jgi:hypothetical protein
MDAKPLTERMFDRITRSRVIESQQAQEDRLLIHEARNRIQELESLPDPGPQADAAPPRGCICPAGANIECRAWLCPRQPVSVNGATFTTA